MPGPVIGSPNWLLYYASENLPPDATQERVNRLVAEAMRRGLHEGVHGGYFSRRDPDTGVESSFTSLTPPGAPLSVLPRRAITRTHPLCTRQLRRTRRA